MSEREGECRETEGERWGCVRAGGGDGALTHERTYGRAEKDVLNFYRTFIF
jgi:hypothetical protein